MLLTYQSYSDEVKSAAASKNKAVALENRVKIKYVSIKNAVDYTYEKYHVKNSKEFVYNYEQYLLAVKTRSASEGQTRIWNTTAKSLFPGA